MSAHLDRSTCIPLYHQLKAILLEGIRSGRLQPGDRLPPEEQLAQIHTVSLITVRRALSDLAAAGWLRREKGRGTFVNQPRLAQGPRELTSFTQEMARRGLRASSRVLLQTVIPAAGEVADSLCIPEGAEVFLLRRLRLADDEPMGIQTAHVPLALAPGLAGEDFSSASLYVTLARKFGLVPSRAREVHSAVYLEGETAAELGVTEGALGLAARRTTYLADERPLEFVDSVMRGDRYQIVLELASGARGL